MTNEPDPREDEHFKEFEQHRKKFYELIGHNVTLYQTVEDYLISVFKASLDTDEERAAAIFGVARGLEAKLNIISAALVGRSEHIAKHWPGLLARVTQAAKARNEIAHATPLHRGGGVTITIDPETREALKAERTGKDRMELRKKTRAGETVWTLDMMFAEYRKTEKLFSNLISFTKLLKGGTPAPHLLDGLAD